MSIDVEAYGFVCLSNEVNSGVCVGSSLDGSLCEVVGLATWDCAIGAGLAVCGFFLGPVKVVPQVTSVAFEMLGNGSKGLDGVGEMLAALGTAEGCFCTELLTHSKRLNPLLCGNSEGGGQQH